MRRAERAAASLIRGKEILDTLLAARRNLGEAARKSVPPVGVVSELLLERYGPEVKLTPVRQFIGLAVRAILEEEGFEVDQTGVRLNGDPVFRTGAVYRRIIESPIDEDEMNEFLENFVRWLRPDRAKRLVHLLSLHHPRALKSKAKGARPLTSKPD
jgi:hypothetical protein